MAGIHDKHRERVRKEFLKRGFNENTPDHKILEMLLFYAIPRKDTNELAHILINHFGSLTAVLEADINELMKINGVGENAAALIKLILPIAGAYERSKLTKNTKFRNMDEIFEYFRKKYYGITNETFSILSFDAAGKVCGFDFLSSGDVAAVGITTRMVIETVIRHKATSAIIAHNHPQGSLLPSADDVIATEKISNAFKQINVLLVDHLIICDNDYVSLSVSKDYKHFFTLNDDNKQS